MRSVLTTPSLGIGVLVAALCVSRAAPVADPRASAGTDAVVAAAIWPRALLGAGGVDFQLSVKYASVTTM